MKNYKEHYGAFRSRYSLTQKEPRTSNSRFLPPEFWRQGSSKHTRADSTHTRRQMDEPLDFEAEDPLTSSSVVVQKSRKKVIGLDDLLTDYYKDKSKVVQRESKRAKTREKYDSDEDDNGREALLSRKINQCHDQMKGMSGEEEISSWNIQVFGNQKTLPPVVFPGLESCSLLQSFMSHDLNLLVELTAENAETFLEGLLMDGWLSKVVSVRGHVESLIAKWTFNLMLYSSREELTASACDFWCTIISSLNEVEKIPIRADWLPGFLEMKRALELYGYLFSISSPPQFVNSQSGSRGPPKNIRSWIKFITACFRIRGGQHIFSLSDAEELVEIIICLCLDCQLQGLLMLLCQCMQSVISYFTDEEWGTSCEKIAKSLASRVPGDFNCLQTVECISGSGTRFNHLRSTLSYNILLICFDNKVANEEEILSTLISINVKDKNCDLLKTYIYLVLTQNWLLHNPILKERPIIYEMWGVYLQNCSCHITSTDLRPYASKVRTKASYLLYGTTKK